jgi:hypothetical protein
MSHARNVAGSEQNTGRGGWAARLALVAVVLVLCLVGMEAVLRVVAARPVPALRHDAVLGWNAKLWFEGRERGPEFDVPIRTNGQHMRAAADVAPTSERFRIAVVGDSFVWGHGVREEEPRRGSPKGIVIAPLIRRPAKNAA